MNRFLADENISRTSVEILRQNGLDVLWVSESFPSITDEKVLDIAQRENRIVITFDSDYGEMIYAKGLERPLGIIYLRLRTNDESEPARILLRYLQTTPDIFDGRFTVITKNGIRYKSL